MSVTPSIFVRSLRTEAAQPPQTIFGTLSDTRTPSVTLGAAGVSGTTADDGTAAGAGEFSTETGPVSVEQPAKDAMTLPDSSMGTNFFTMILQKTNNTKMVVIRDSPGAYLDFNGFHQPDTLTFPSASPVVPVADGCFHCTPYGRRNDRGISRRCSKPDYSGLADS
jgi:hypothetical protein